MFPFETFLFFHLRHLYQEGVRQDMSCPCDQPGWHGLEDTIGEFGKKRKRGHMVIGPDHVMVQPVVGIVVNG